MATIKEVALASGVSIATVSYILNGREVNIRPDTRERVLRSIRELNYRPNARFRGQNTRLKNTIGIIYPHWDAHLTEEPYYAYLLDGILYALSSRHWNTTIFAEQNWEGAIASLRTFCDGRCDGLILAGPDDRDDLLGALQDRGFPFVLINSGSEHAEINSVDVDNRTSAYDVTTYLIQQGHRRIAFLPGSPLHDGTKQRLSGFLRTLQENGIVCHPAYTPVGHYTILSGHDRTHALLGLPFPERPTALFCANDIIAKGAYQAVQERGLRIPDDLSIVGFDDLNFAQSLNPPLTTMRQPLIKMGEYAVEILLEQINAGATQHRTVRKQVVPTELVVRESVAAPAANP